MLCYYNIYCVYVYKLTGDSDICPLSTVDAPLSDAQVLIQLSHSLIALSDDTASYYLDLNTAYTTKDG